jgi:hypothetical protein
MSTALNQVKERIEREKEKGLSDIRFFVENPNDLSIEELAQDVLSFFNAIDQGHYKPYQEGIR